MNMDIRLLRGWMYDRVNPANRTLKEEFKSGVYGFIDHVMSQPGLVSSANEIRCPCRKCGNRKHIKCDVVVVHLCKWGFKEDYWYWTSHGEVEPTVNNNNVKATSSGHFIHNEGNNRYEDLEDSAGSISHFSRAKSRMRLEDELRKKLRRDPRQGKIFFAQYAKKNADGELQEWANRKAETAFTVETLRSQASNSDGEELAFPPLDDQLKICAETQGVSKKGTVYGLSRRASKVRPTRSTYTSNTVATDPETSERLSILETQLATVLNSVETIKKHHKAELETIKKHHKAQLETIKEQHKMQKMMYASLLSTLQNQGGTSQSSQPFSNFTNHVVSQLQAGTSQSGMIYSHFPHILGPNTFPMFLNIPRTTDPQPSQQGQSHGANDTCVPETLND